MKKIFAMISVVAALSMMIAGCNTTAESETETVTLQLSCAASLTEAMTELSDAYMEANENIELVLNFAGSGSLRAQIENGADVDFFFSAAQNHMDTLEEQDLLLSGSRTDVVGNDLVLIQPADATAIASMEDLSDEAIREIAIGETETVPAGKYALQVLEDLGLYDTLSDKVIQGKDVKEVLSYVETGNADAGFVFNTDAATSDKIIMSAEIPAEVKPAILYPAAIIAETEYPDEVTAFMEYLTTEEGLAFLYKYHFTPAS